MVKHRPRCFVHGVKNLEQQALAREKDSRAWAEYLLFKAPLAEVLLRRVARANGRPDKWLEGADFLCDHLAEILRSDRLFTVRWHIANGGKLSTGVHKDEIVGEYGFDEIEAAIDKAIHLCRQKRDNYVRFRG